MGTPRPNVRFWKSAVRWQDVARTPWPQVALAGRSNVGKSSLVNLLTGRRRLARTSSTPGRTQTLNLFVVDERFVLVDLPGYGYARAPVGVVRAWTRTTREFVARSESLRAVVLLVDIRREPTDDDVRFADLVRGAGRRLLVAVTKADKVPRRPAHLKAIAEGLGIPQQGMVLTSARTGEGRADLWRAIRELAGRGPGVPKEAGDDA
ncbi:MAG: YihA family ribosome biogenesis GTP-binding protein [Deltaproteobacteria bacterium]|nr:YihA family ribosome biogenesis GTP-binding protein [Deltaproteobacteria bacterium]